MSHAEHIAIEEASLVDVVNWESNLFDRRKLHARGAHGAPLVGWCDYLLFLWTRFQLLLDHVTEIAQSLAVVVAEFARGLVHNAQRPNVVSTRSLHGMPGVEPDVGLVENDWVLREAWIEHRVLDDHRLFSGDGMAAERELA